jgi:hypothetical protein
VRGGQTDHSLQRARRDGQSPPVARVRRLSGNSDVSASGFRVQGSGLRVYDLGFRV